MVNEHFMWSCTVWFCSQRSRHILHTDSGHTFYFFKAKVLQESQVGGSDRRKKQNSNMCFVCQEVAETAQEMHQEIWKFLKNLLKTSVFTIKAHVDFIQFKLEADITWNIVLM